MDRNPLELDSNSYWLLFAHSRRFKLSSWNWIKISMWKNCYKLISSLPFTIRSIYGKYWWTVHLTSLFVSDGDIVQWTHDAIITSFLRQNDVTTSLWPNNDVIITLCVHWVAGVVLLRWAGLFVSGKIIMWNFEYEWNRKWQEMFWWISVLNGDILIITTYVYSWVLSTICYFWLVSWLIVNYDEK